MIACMEGLDLFSKKVLNQVLLTVLIGGSLIGCGLEIGEKPAPEGEVHLDGYSCVNEISHKVGRYFDSKLSEPEITEFIDCLKKSVSDFTKMVEREPGTQFFDPEKLRKFINRISKNRELTPELLTEFMKIKQTFVGGRIDQISAGDLSAALSLLEDIKSAALILRPHVQIFNSSLGSEIPPEKISLELDRSSQALGQVTRIFVNSLRATKNKYSLKDFEKFLEEFREFIDWHEVFPDGRPAKSWIELIASAKEISTGGDRYLIEETEWESFLTVCQSAYIAYLKVKYGVSGQILWSGVGLKNLVHVVDQVRDQVIQIISSRKNRMIPKDEVAKLVQSLGEIEWLPFGLSADIFNKGLELFVSKILDEGQRGEFLGYRISHLLKMAGEFEAWANTQSYISLKVGDHSREQGSRPVPQVFDEDLLGDEESVIYHKVTPLSWIQFEEFLKDRRPLFMPDDRRVAVTYAESLEKDLGVKFDLHNLSMTHLLYRVLKLIYQSYGVRGDGGALLLSADTLQKFYSDFFEVGEALKWLDSRSKNAGSRSYVEGNLFTYSANGMVGEYALNLSEGVDLIAYLLTAGRVTHGVYSDLGKICRQGLVDFRNQPKLERACVENHLAQVLIGNMGFAPDLRKWLLSQTLERQRAYTDLLLRAAFSNQNSDSLWLEKSELSTISVVILYSESILTRFDEDRDGSLNNAEVLMAFPVFREFINSLAKNLLKEDEDLPVGRVRAIYEFILHYRKAPETRGDLLSVIWNTPWWSDNGQPIYMVDSDRMQLTEAFSVIISRLLNGT